MIRVTVEIIPGGNEKRARTLATMVIANDGSGTPPMGNYRGLLEAEYTDGRPGSLKNFNRSTQSVWTLVGSFLKLWGHTRHSPKLMEKEEGDVHKLQDVLLP